MNLRVVALRGAVQQDSVAEFRQLLGRSGSCAFEQRTQLEDVFKELALPK